MEPIKDPYGDYLMRLAQQFPGIDQLIIAGGFVPADQIHDYANAYGPGGQFYYEPFNMAAARQSGRIQPPAFAVPFYEASGMGKSVDGVFVWSKEYTAPYSGMPKV